MFMSGNVRSVGLVLVTGFFAVVARGELLVTYESDIDRDASTPGIIDLNTDDIATITIGLIALDGEVLLGGAGFDFAGTPVGGPFDRVVVNGALTVSDFAFADPFQDANVWFTSDRLPDPTSVTHSVVGLPSFPLTLATFNVMIADSGYVVQDIGPPNIFDGQVVPIDVAAGSASFTVRSTVPEPATGLLLIVATAAVATRRTVGRVSPAEREN